MLPILYQKNGLTKKGVLEDCITANVHERRNADFELLVSYPIGYPLFNDIRVGDVIEAHANDKLRNQKFRIYNIQKFLKTRIMIRCRHISFDAAFDKVDGISLTNASCEYALNEIFRNSVFSKHYRGFSDIINAQDYNMPNESVQRAIVGAKGSIIDTYGVGAEILRDNYNIHVLQHRGRDNGVVIAYGDNLTGFDATEDDTKVLTRVRGYVKRHEEGKEVVVYGDYIVSDKEGLYPHPKIQDIDYSNRFEYGVTPTKEQINELARNEFKINKVDIPNINYKIEFIPLSRCVGYEDVEDRIGLCDTVTIKNKVYDIETKAKVVKYSFNCLTDRYESMEIGNIQTAFNVVIGGMGGTTITGGGLTKDEVQGLIDKTPSTNYPDLLPNTPVLSGKVYGFDSLELTWTFEQQPYLNYEVYGSRTKGFTPTEIDLLYRGQASTYVHKGKPGEKWYFKVCAINTKASRTPFSNEIELESRKVDSFEEYFSHLAVGNLVTDIFSTNYMEAGIIKANWVELKGASVIDGNGKRTFDIDSFGRITLMPSVFKMIVDGREEEIVTKTQFEQSSEAFDFKVKSSQNNPNLINNAWNLGGLKHWQKVQWDANDTSHYMEGQLGVSNFNNWCPKGQYVMEIINKGGDYNNHWFGAKQTVKVTPGETYTVSYYVAGHRVKSNELEIKRTDNDNHISSKSITSIKSGREGGATFEDDFTFVTLTFFVPADCYSIDLYIYSKGKNGTSHSYMWIARTQLEKGTEATNRRIGANEVNSNTTRIDGDGIEIIHQNNSKTIINHEKVEFTSPNGNASLRLKNGGINFLESKTNELVGFAKTSTMTDNLEINGVTISTYGSGDYLAIGQSNSYDETDWLSVPSIILGKVDDHTHNWYKGVNFVNENVFLRSRTFLKNTMEVGMGNPIEFNGQSGTNATIMGQPTGKLWIHAEAGLDLGVRQGNEYSSAIRINKSGGGTYNQEILLFGNVVNYNSLMLRNADIKTHLTPQSLQLKQKNKMIKDVFVPFSVNEDEIRYTHTEEILMNEKTMIVELPQLLAENIRNDYHVNIGKISWGDYRIVEKTPYYFEIESNVDCFKFTYEIVAQKIEKPKENICVASLQYLSKGAVEGEVNDKVSYYIDNGEIGKNNYWRLYTNKF